MAFCPMFVGGSHGVEARLELTLRNKGLQGANAGHLKIALLGSCNGSEAGPFVDDETARPAETFI